jgi:hypothetical protein
MAKVIIKESLLYSGKLFAKGSKHEDSELPPRFLNNDYYVEPVVEDAASSTEMRSEPTAPGLVLVPTPGFNPNESIEI